MTAGAGINSDLLEMVRRERAEALAREPELEAARHQLSVTLHNSTMFTAQCSCRWWAIENYQVSHSVDEAAARQLVEERHREHVLNMGGPGGTKVKLGYTTGKCTPMTITTQVGSVSFGVLCNDRAKRNRCQVCKENWSIAQCDYPVGGPCKKCRGSGVKDGYNCQTCAGTGRRMCNRYLCNDCRTHREPEEDYCPEHRVAAGFPPLVRKEPCAWALKPQLVNRKCLREKCGVLISADDRVLYFPRRRRAMCLACGRVYLEVAQ